MNTGDREASNVRIVLSDKILYASCDSDVLEIEYKKNFIEIKSLRPDTSATLSIWAEGYPSTSWKPLQLNSKEASGKVDIGEVYYGFSSSIACFISFIIDNPKFYGIMLVFLIGLVFLSIISIEGEKKKK